jgi:hypothetical protein
VSGGFVPRHRYGQIIDEPIHIADWYVTLPSIVRRAVSSSSSSSGGRHDDDMFDDDDDEPTMSTNGSKIPPVDGIDIWPLITGESSILTSNQHDFSTLYTNKDMKKMNDKRNPLLSWTSSSSSSVPPREIPLSQQALLIGDYKLIWNRNRNITLSGWTTPTFPTSHDSISTINQTIDCRSGCLYNVRTDPSEYDDLSTHQPERLQYMKERLIYLRTGFYDNDERGVDSCPYMFNNKSNIQGHNSDKEKYDDTHGHDHDHLPCACWMAINYYGGFLGPYQEVELLPDFVAKAAAEAKAAETAARRAAAAATTTTTIKE